MSQTTNPTLEIDKIPQPDIIVPGTLLENVFDNDMEYVLYMLKKGMKNKTLKIVKSIEFCMPSKDINLRVTETSGNEFENELKYIEDLAKGITITYEIYRTRILL